MDSSLLSHHSTDSRDNLPLINETISIDSARLSHTWSSNFAHEDADSDPFRERLNKKLEAGYSLVGHRTGSGEHIAALFRGPLRFNAKASDGAKEPAFTPRQSKCGTDLQFTDPETGAVDISYSTAWSLGRALALNDQHFVVSFARLNIKLHRGGSISETATRPGRMSREDLMSRLQKLGSSLDLSRPSVISHGTPSTRTNPEINGPETNLEGQASEEGSAADRVFATMSELLTANEPDWITVRNWVLDHCYFLTDVPAHYLFPDVKILSGLNDRIIISFDIDKAWIECLIDGGLSLGNNHLARDDDVTRTAIKRSIAEFLDDCARKNAALKDNRGSRVPTWGFVFQNNDNVTLGSSSKLQVELTKKSGNMVSSVHVQQLGDGVLLCLFDGELSEEQVTFLNVRVKVLE